MYISWKNALVFYQYYCKNNQEFLNKMNEIPLGDYNNDSLQKKR